MATLTQEEVFNYWGALSIIELGGHVETSKAIQEGDWRVLDKVPRILRKCIHDKDLETPFVETDEVIEAYMELIKRKMGIYACEPDEVEAVITTLKALATEDQRTIIDELVKYLQLPEGSGYLDFLEHASTHSDECDVFACIILQCSKTILDNIQLLPLE